MEGEIFGFAKFSSHTFDGNHIFAIFGSVIVKIRLEEEIIAQKDPWSCEIQRE